jgi:hypothetical protein
VIFPEPITCKIAEHIEEGGASDAVAPATLLAMLQTALRLEGGSEFEVHDATLRFRMAGWASRSKSSWHWSAYVTSGELTLIPTANGFIAEGRLQLWRLATAAVVPLGLAVLFGTRLWVGALIGIGLWLIGYEVAKTSFQEWIRQLLGVGTMDHHRAPVAP